jgi:hypothetical protein
LKKCVYTLCSTMYEGIWFKVSCAGLLKWNGNYQIEKEFPFEWHIFQPKRWKKPQLFPFLRTIVNKKV